MAILYLILILTGTIGIAYGLNIVVQKRAEIYRKGEIQRYEGKAAQALGSGLSITGLGVVALGSLGFHPAVIFFGILCSGAFFVGRSIADRIQAENNGLSLPSQKKKRQ
jgi:hypothetical protein